MNKLYEQINKAIKSFSPMIMSVGYQIAIFNDKEIVYKKQDGFDSLKPAIKTNDHSMYMIGSNTKVFTAVSILQLMEDGKLSLSDDIKKYIPELSFKSLYYGWKSKECIERSGRWGFCQRVLPYSNQEKTNHSSETIVSN